MSPWLVTKLVRNMECGLGKNIYSPRGGHFSSLAASPGSLSPYSRLRCCFRLNAGFEYEALARRLSSFATPLGAFVEEDKTLNEKRNEPREQAETKLTVIAFDIETTGFKSEGHRIIEFAARDLSGGPLSTISTLVNPGRYVPFMITQITGITNEMVNQPNVPSWKEVGPEIIRFVESRRQEDQPLILVAHNGRTFDVPFLLKEFQSCSIEVPGWWLFLDSMALARETKKKHRYGWPSLRLSDIYDSYGLKTTESAHRAMSDVNMLASVLEMLVADLQMPPAEFLSKSFNAEDVLAASKRAQAQERDELALGSDTVPEEMEPGKDIDPEISVENVDGAMNPDDSRLVIDVENEEPELRKTSLDSGSVDLEVLCFLPQQYVKLKRQRPEFVHLMSDGDFYEAYFEDAENLAATCKAVLSSINVSDSLLEGEIEAPFVSFPPSKHHLYIHSLLQSGQKIVKIHGGYQKIVSVLTPGMVLEEGMLDESRNNFVASVNLVDDSSSSWGLACCDLSTGELYATQSAGVPGLVEELYRLEPAEIVTNLKAFSVIPSSMLRFTQTSSELTSTTEDSELLSRLTGADELRGRELSASAANALLRYVQKTQEPSLRELPVRKLGLYNVDEYLFMDSNTRKFLKLMEPEAKQNSLFWAMDNTKTLMGSRLLKRWLSQPLRSLEQIRSRQNAIKVLVKDSISRGALRSILTSVVDMERVAGMLVRQPDLSWDYLRSLADSLLALPKLSLVLDKLPENFHFSEVKRHQGPATKLAEQIQGTRISEQGESLREAVANVLSELQETSQALAALDVLCSFAEIAATRHYCAPELVPDGRQLTIAGGRHPVLELIADFTPNSCHLGSQPGSSDLLIVTGSNRSGKSSYLQQVALIQLLAQCGSFVPASEAKLSIADAILTSGSSDLSGVLEMASPSSLVLLDDFNPSGEDSEALSTAVIEYLANHVSSRSVITMESYHLDLHLKHSSISASSLKNHTLLAGVLQGAVNAGRYPEWVCRRVRELTGAGHGSDSVEELAVESTIAINPPKNDLIHLWQQAIILLQSSPATLALAKQKGALVSVSTTPDLAIVRIGSSPVFVKKFRQQEHAAALEAAFESLLNQPVKLEVEQTE